MKTKNLKKKIRRIEKRLQEDPKKLVKLKQRLQAAETAKKLKAARKSAPFAPPAQPPSLLSERSRRNRCCQESEKASIFAGTSRSTCGGDES
jgi:hypothetical protein